jgi:hypothetical protein
VIPSTRQTLWTRLTDLIEKQLVHVTGEYLLAPTEYAFGRTAELAGEDGPAAGPDTARR